MVFFHNVDGVFGDHYKTLGVDEKASDKDIGKAFRRLSLKHHPDKNPNDANAPARFAKLTDAYDTLMDSDKRRRYDADRHWGGGTWDGWGNNHHQRHHHHNSGWQRRNSDGGGGGGGRTQREREQELLRQRQRQRDKEERQRRERDAREKQRQQAQEEERRQKLREAQAKRDAEAKLARRKAKRPNLFDMAKHVKELNEETYWNKVGAKGESWVVLFYNTGLRDMQGSLLPKRGEHEDDIATVSRTAARSFHRALKLLPREFDAAAVEWGEGGGSSSSTRSGGGVGGGGGGAAWRKTKSKLAEEVNFVQCRKLESSAERRRCAAMRRSAAAGLRESNASRRHSQMDPPSHESLSKRFTSRLSQPMSTNVSVGHVSCHTVQGHIRVVRDVGTGMSLTTRICRARVLCMPQCRAAVKLRVCIREQT